MITPQIALTLAILLAAVILFITEKIRIDLVALLVLVALALTGLISPAEAISGFSNPAVVTVWAVFILSAALSRTGVASVVGRQFLRLAAMGEVVLIGTIMLAAAALSAFMNNVGVAALLLPVVVDLAKATRRPPSRLLIPLAYGAMMGGTTTLIGTSSNILASEFLAGEGLQPFGLFDFTPVGLSVTAAGILFMLLIGRRLLPHHDPIQMRKSGVPVTALESNLFVVEIPTGSALAGKNLAESRIGKALHFNVLAILRGGDNVPAPGPETLLKDGDRLLVSGERDHWQELARQELVYLDQDLSPDSLVSPDIALAEVRLAPGSSLIGQTVTQARFRERFGATVLALFTREGIHRKGVHHIPLGASDVLLVQLPAANIESLEEAPEIGQVRMNSDAIFQLQEQLLALRIPPESGLVGKTLAESRLGEAFDLAVMGIARAGKTDLLPSPDTRLQADDTLLIEGRFEDVSALGGLQLISLMPAQADSLESLEGDEVGFVEVVLSPHTTLAGRTLTELNFREKYGLTVVAIWRSGQPYTAELQKMPLQFGDALLVQGPWSRIKVLAAEPDYIVLAEAIQDPPRLQKAPLAVLIMLGVVAVVLTGWLPLVISAVAGAALMVLTGCLSMEEAYQNIEWRTVFLIAGMLPLGIAMEQTGTATFVASHALDLMAAVGQLPLLAGLFLLTVAAAQFMPNVVVVVLISPIAITTAIDMSLSPYPLVMVVAVAASVPFLSPISHPANALIMGPGGYSLNDYLKVGLPLMLVTLIVTLLVLPIFWPL